MCVLALASGIFRAWPLGRKNLSGPYQGEGCTDWSAPTTVSEIQSFLGLAGYYLRFIEGFSKITKPMTELLKKDKKFVWTEDCERSFNELRIRLTSAPVLALPDIYRSFDVYCDASRKRTWVCTHARWQGGGLCISTTAETRRKLPYS